MKFGSPEIVNLINKEENMKYESLVNFLESEIGKRVVDLSYGNHGNRSYFLITVESHYAQGLVNEAENFGMTNYNFDFLWSGKTLYMISK